MTRLCTVSLLVLAFLLCSANLASAQIFSNSKERSNFRWNFFPAFLGRLSGQYEYAGQRLGANLSGNISFAGRKTGYLLGSNFRYFLSEKRTTFFIGGVGNFSDYSEDVKFKNAAGTEEQTSVRGKLLLLALNGGVRVNILRIFNFHARIGYAPPIELDFKTGSETMPQNDFDVFKKDFRMRSAFDGEVSFGIRF
jgi:hypothetical protein